MSERNAPQTYGVRIGLVSGLFSIGQVALSVAAAHGSEAQVRAIQRAFSILSSGGIADPTVLIAPLAPMLLTTYLSMLALGLLAIWFAGQAGRLAAVAQGRRVGGASAGMWVWLISTLIWLVASVVATVVTNSDGTVSGVFSGTYSAAFLSQELLFLLLQEVLGALICLGFCALAGSYGARHAMLVAPEAPPAGVGGPMMGRLPQGAYPYAPYPPYPPYPTPGYPAYPPYAGGQYPGAYPAPQQPYPAYPTYPGYPAHPGSGGYTPPQAQPPQPPTGVTQPFGALPYPPPPSFYVPQQIQQPTQQTTTAPQSEPPSAPFAAQPE